MHTYTFFFIHSRTCCVCFPASSPSAAGGESGAGFSFRRSLASQSILSKFHGARTSIGLLGRERGAKAGEGRERRKEREASPREGPEQEALRARGPTSAAARLAVARRVGAARREREGLVSAFQRKQ